MRDVGLDAPPAKLLVMNFKLVNARSWKVLGTFDDEDAARATVRATVAAGGAAVSDLVVYVSEEDGFPRRKYSDETLASWAGVALART